MGEEWAASTPWQFFTSHPEPELGRATAEGRIEEFAAMDMGPQRGSRPAGSGHVRTLPVAVGRARVRHPPSHPGSLHAADRPPPGTARPHGPGFHSGARRGRMKGPSTPASAGRPRRPGQLPAACDAGPPHRPSSPPHPEPPRGRRGRPSVAFGGGDDRRRTLITRSVDAQPDRSVRMIDRSP